MPEGHKETLQLTFIPQVLAWYIHYQQIYSTNIYFPKYIISQNIYFPTLCPKGTRKPSNLHSSPKCWHDISITKVFIQLTYISQIVGTIYEYWYTILTFIYIPKNCSIYTIHIYIVFKFFIPSVFKNITYVDLCFLKLYLCLSVYVYLCICNFRHP